MGHRCFRSRPTPQPRPPCRSLPFPFPFPIPPHLSRPLLCHLLPGSLGRRMLVVVVVVVMMVGKVDVVVRVERARHAFRHGTIAALLFQHHLHPPPPPVSQMRAWNDRRFWIHCCLGNNKVLCVVLSPHHSCVLGCHPRHGRRRRRGGGGGGGRCQLHL